MQQAASWLSQARRPVLLIGRVSRDEGGWADAGHGTIPWKTLWPIIRNKTRAGYLIAEHDNPNDIDRFASRSIATIQSFGA